MRIRAISYDRNLNIWPRLFDKLGLGPGVATVRLDDFGANVSFAAANLINGRRRNAFLQLAAVPTDELDSILAGRYGFNADRDGFLGRRVRLEFNSRRRVKVTAL